MCAREKTGVVLLASLFVTPSLKITNTTFVEIPKLHRDIIRASEHIGERRVHDNAPHVVCVSFEFGNSVKQSVKSGAVCTASDT